MQEIKIDRLIVGLDRCVRTLFGAHTAARPYPGASLQGGEASGRKLAIGLMRVNHSGEVCAQALYQGQALFAREEHVRRALLISADEECDHLAWTAQRLNELGGRSSVFNPFWYAGAWTIGAGASLLGDAVSLGFLQETERQVVAHLEGHLLQLPPDDLRSKAVLQQMRDDEASHAVRARELGAYELPVPLPLMMRLAAQVLTRFARFV